MNSFDNFRSQVAISQSFPTGKIDVSQSLLLFDEVLLKTDVSSQETIQFIKKFTQRVGFKGGESLKDFKSFPKNLDAVLKKWPTPINRSQHLVVLGGGSLGDFGGFIASVLKRGVRLIQIPSTWLAAMDSAHGGKNGLNFDGSKNQIGTFYPPEAVYIVKELLETNPIEVMEQSYGELIKMALVGDSHFFKEIAMEKREARDFLWRFMPQCIEDKYAVILQDPFETKAIRQILNFGHTFGHALESHFGWAHGDSVLQGVFFALEWSRHRGVLSDALYSEFVHVIAQKFDRVPAQALDWYKRPSAKTLGSLIGADKKMTGTGQIQFVFLKNVGQPVLEKVAVADILEEAKRQLWVK